MRSKSHIRLTKALTISLKLLLLLNIYPPVIGQRQTLAIECSANFSLQQVGYFVFRKICTYLGVPSDPIFLQISLNIVVH